MFARALAQHHPPSPQQQKLTPPGKNTVQKSLLEFSGTKRKALNEISPQPNKNIPLPAVVTEQRAPRPQSTLISALANTNSFRDGRGSGLIELDGQVFDEAEFDDVGFEDWSDPVKPLQDMEMQAGSNKENPVVIDNDEDFFHDDIAWDEGFDSQAGNVEQQLPLTTIHSSPPIREGTADVPVIIEEDPLPKQVLQETVPPPSEVPPSAQPSSTIPPTPLIDLRKTLFPSSAPLSWSPSPIPPPRPTKQRTLPWRSNPERYDSPSQQSPFPPRRDYSQPISIVRNADKKRNISTMAMDAPPVDWDVLGFTEKDIFEREREARRREVERKNELARIGTEWIDQATRTAKQPVDAAEAVTVAGRRHKKNAGVDEKKKGPDKPERKQIAKLFLSQEQLSVRKMVVEQKKCVFFTGSAGTGKSVLLREIISALKKLYERNPEAVAVTASTGLAACNVGGITLHSFAGFGLGRGEIPELVRVIKKNKKSFERWRRTRVLIIDEISMVDAAMFDKLEALARTLRKDERPFGGIQLVITGDFFQLPPVANRGQLSKFAFEATSWNKAVPNTIKLTSVFRQKDQEFVTMLNEMRLGVLSPQSIRNFLSLSRPPQFDDGIEPTELYPTRDEVERANNTRLHSLPGSTHTFHAEQGGAITNLQVRNKLLENCMAPQRIDLKKDSQVMLIKNMDENLVNGSLGKVIGFMSEATYSLCEREAIELESALTFDSRATAAGSDDPFGFSNLEQDPDDSESVARKKRKILKLRAMAADTSQLWPLVRFTTATGLHIDRLVTREKWSFETPEGEVQAYRRQIPLILAYAISIHKAQGQTLSRVRVDLGRVFEKGQAYVALSRATCREGLQILRFDARKVMAHPRVAAFYRQLDGVGEINPRKEDVGVGRRMDEAGVGWDAKALEELMEDDEFEAYG